MTEPALRHQGNSVDAAIESAVRVLQLEAEGLVALSAQIGPSFVEAADALARMTGRAIVTGMGKSGHIARKIAATLASTGTPAVFVHPAEASHGDLGMIAATDVILALSNSGETAELADIVTYAKRFEIPLIAISGKRASALGRAADILLVLAETAEACPMGLAPTTSTTMMLGLGDALAVALLERKGFSAGDFHVLHPGGKLGRMLLQVADIMHTGESVPLINRNAKMADALIAMTAKSFGCVGIVDDQGRLVGIITDGDLRRHMRRDLVDLDVAQVMTLGAKSVGPNALASEALGIMNAKGITNLFVVDDGRPLGIIHIHDCLRAGVA